MNTMIPSAAARRLIERDLEPRRHAFREALLLVLLEHPDAAGRAERQGTMARVHDLCAKELAERVRIAGTALRRAYAGGPEITTSILLDELKREVEGYLTSELADLAADEYLVTRLLDRLPGFLPDRLNPAVLDSRP